MRGWVRITGTWQRRKTHRNSPPKACWSAAAKKIGKAAGKVAAVAGAAADAPAEAAPPAPKPQTKSVKVPKLAKKNKMRLPRKEKKAQQKAANRQLGGLAACRKSFRGHRMSTNKHE